MKSLLPLGYIKILHLLETLVIIAVPIIIQEITIAIMRTIQEIIAIISTTIKTIPQQIPSHPTKSTLAIIWKKLRKVTGYQVQFCAKSNFKKGTIERKFKQKVTKTKVRPVKSKKKYYVRMRPYTKSGSKTYYGKWSKVKSVKIK